MGFNIAETRPGTEDAFALKPSPRFPGLAEIVGGVAALVPFSCSMASSHMETVNGHTVSYVYRDWIALTCGAVAVLMALVAFVLVRRTIAARRMVRVLAAVGLLALGAVQVLRGVGVLAGPNRVSQSLEPADHGVKRHA